MRPTLASDQARSATARSSLRTTPPSPALRFLLDWKEKVPASPMAPTRRPRQAPRGPGRVLHHLQPVATGDGRHGVQVRRLAGDVHGDDGPRARSHPPPGVCASIRYVSGRMSQKTGMAPMASTAVAVATKV